MTTEEQQDWKQKFLDREAEWKTLIKLQNKEKEILQEKNEKLSSTVEKLRSELSESEKDLLTTKSELDQKERLLDFYFREQESSRVELVVYKHRFQEIEKEYNEKKRENEFLKQEISNKKTPFQNIKNLVSPRKMMASESNFEEVQSPRQIKHDMISPLKRKEIADLTELELDSKKKKLFKENNFVIDQ
eukprot:gene1696-465_t